MKFSKDLLELRDKEAKLVKMKRYEEAEKVKMKADLLEEFERNKLEADVSSNLNHLSEKRRLLFVSEFEFKLFGRIQIKWSNYRKRIQFKFKW